jgi:hypothetical protein
MYYHINDIIFLVRFPQFVGSRPRRDVWTTAYCRGLALCVPAHTRNADGPPPPPPPPPAPLRPPPGILLADEQQRRPSGRRLCRAPDNRTTLVSASHINGSSPVLGPARASVPRPFLPSPRGPFPLVAPVCPTNMDYEKNPVFTLRPVLS